MGNRVGVRVSAIIGDGLTEMVEVGVGVEVVGRTYVMVGVNVIVMVGVSVGVGDSAGGVKVAVSVPSGVPVDSVGVRVNCGARRLEAQISPNPIQ